MFTVARVNNLSPNEGRIATKAITFDGSAGNGAIGTIPLFNVTGDVVADIFATCTNPLTGASATLQLGISGNAGIFIATTTATAIVGGDTWQDNGPSTGETVGVTRVLAGGVTPLLTIATAGVMAGSLRFYCLWRPLSADGNVVAA